MQDLDSRFTKLAFALAANRELIVGDGDDASCRHRPPPHRLLPGLVGFATVWLGFVTLGFWL